MARACHSSRIGKYTWWRNIKGYVGISRGVIQYLLFIPYLLFKLTENLQNIENFKELKLKIVSTNRYIRRIFLNCIHPLITIQLFIRFFYYYNGHKIIVLGRYITEVISRHLFPQYFQDIFKVLEKKINIAFMSFEYNFKDFMSFSLFFNFRSIIHTLFMDCRTKKITKNWLEFIELVLKFLRF